MSDKTLTVTNTSTLSAFSTRDSLKEMSDRLRKMMPSAQQFSEGEALAVAQVALAHGLDPFTGEVWGLKSQDGKWYGVMVGIKGLRKSANREAAAEDTVFWTEIIQVEPQTVGAQPGAIAYTCILRDTKRMQAYGKSLAILTGAGISASDARAMIGNAPQVVGVGIATSDERSKMGIHARAKKRAEADALRQRFDIHFSSARDVADSGDGELETVDGVFADSEPSAEAEQPKQATTPEQRAAAERQALMELGY